MSPRLTLSPFVAYRTQVDGGALVRAAELGQLVFLHRRLERHEFLVGRAVIVDTDDCGVHIFHHTCAFGRDPGAGVADKLPFDAGRHNRSLATEQRHGLAHHVRAHQRTVRVVVLKERNQRSGDGRYHG